MKNPELARFVDSREVGPNYNAGQGRYGYVANYEYLRRILNHFMENRVILSRLEQTEDSIEGQKKYVLEKARLEETSIRTAELIEKSAGLFLNSLGLVLLKSTFSDINPNAAKYVESVLSRVFEDTVREYPDLNQMMVGVVDPESGAVDIKKLIILVDGGVIKLTSEHIFYVAKILAERITLEQRELNLVFEKNKIEFIEAVRRQVSSGLLPASALNNLHRIDSTKVFLEDAFDNLGNTNQLGSYFNGQMYIPNFMLQPHLQDELKRTMFHEFIHLVSGTSITVDSSNAKKPRVFERKVGVSLMDAGGNKRQTWINEAITEILSQELSGIEGRHTYVEEQEELQKMLDKGLDRKLMLAAYFENFVRTKEQPKVGENYANFMKEVYRIMNAEEFSKMESDFDMKKVSSLLRSNMMYPSRIVTAKHLEKFPFKKKITISIGTTENNTLSQDFIFMMEPNADYIENNNRFDSITGEELPPDLWQEAEKLLSKIEQDYGSRLKYVVGDVK